MGAKSAIQKALPCQVQRHPASRGPDVTLRMHPQYDHVRDSCHQTNEVEQAGQIGPYARTPSITLIEVFVGMILDNLKPAASKSA